MNTKENVFESWPEKPYRPSKIVAVGRNYAEHAKEMKSEIPHKPVIFLKPPSSLIKMKSIIINGLLTKEQKEEEGDSNNPACEKLACIVIPPDAGDIHYEVEIGIVMKKACSHIAVENAWDYILGICLLLDITARDIQKEAKKAGEPWTVAKGYDTFCPVSRLLPLDTLRKAGISLNNISFRLLKNGTVVQSGNTSEMIFSAETLISYISTIMTLEEYDLIATGTPAGVGSIGKGDKLICEIPSFFSASVDVR